MIQNLTMDHWSEAEVYRRLDEKMIAAYRAVADVSRNYGMPMRQAAYTLAVERVVRAMEYRGWISTGQYTPHSVNENCG